MSFTTITTRLPDGNEICYMDSGPVEHSTTYTTLVLLHGTGFNGHVFEPLHEPASQYNLRIFVPQRKGYAGSSGYVQAELDDLYKGDPAFLNRTTILLGHFINHLIQEYHLPEPNEDGTSGGIALLGWSMGCASAIPILTDASLFGPEQYKILCRYLTNIILYDPPYTSLGFDPPTGEAESYFKFGKEPLEDFNSYVSCYFDHPSERDWNGDPMQLDLRYRTERSTTISWTPERWQKIFQLKPVQESEWPMARGPIQPSIRDFTCQALCDSTRVGTTFPRVKVIYIACWRSNRTVPWAYYNMKNLYSQEQANGRTVRPVSYRIVEHANHFWHWENPHEFLQYLADALQGK